MASPFRDRRLLEADIQGFLQNHGAAFAQTKQRISACFEMMCFDNIVYYYQTSGYDVLVANLIGNEFHYKLGPSGYPNNFSYFTACKEYRNVAPPRRYEYAIRQNIPVQSSHDPDIFVTPDVCVFSGALENRLDGRYFGGMRAFHFVPAQNVVSMAEAKHYNPSPEMLVNFVGLVNELQPSALQAPAMHQAPRKPRHLAPSLLVSGDAGYHCRRIVMSLRERYTINIFVALFSRPYQFNARKRGAHAELNHVFDQR